MPSRIFACSGQEATTTAKAVLIATATVTVVLFVALIALSIAKTNLLAKIGQKNLTIIAGSLFAVTVSSILLTFWQLQRIDLIN